MYQYPFLRTALQSLHDVGTVDSCIPLCVLYSTCLEDSSEHKASVQDNRSCWSSRFHTASVLRTRSFCCWRSFKTFRSKQQEMLQCHGWLVFSSAAEYRVSRTSKQKHPHPATTVQTEDLDQETYRDIVSPWTVPDDIQRILQDTHDSLFQVECLLVLGMIWYLPFNTLFTSALFKTWISVQNLWVG